MKFVLLSGGSGKRLWPLSNDSRSKQFLRILKNEHGEYESMVQRVWRQMKSCGAGDDSICIATSKSQQDMISSQLGEDVSLIIEPSRKDTFPAIALAATYLYSMEGMGLNEVMTVLPVDTYAEDEFFSKIIGLEQIIQETGAELALIGATPSFPSEKYGYIVPGAEEPGEGIIQVSHFIEKPQQDLALLLMKQNALWNCGVFAFRLGYLIDELVRRGLPVQYEELAKQYERLHCNSFDYEIAERAKHIVAVTYDRAWRDLGTWNTLTEEMKVPVLGKGVVSGDCSNTHVINELDIPVAVLGVSNVVVAASPDGILITEKSASPRLKEIVNQIKQRPMYEERRWGWYRVLDYKKVNEHYEVLTKRICILANKHLSYQMHLRRNEVWTILSGTGEVVLNDTHRKVGAGDVLEVPATFRHSIRATSDMEMIEIQYGPEVHEDDVIRLQLDWDEIVKYCRR